MDGGRGEGREPINVLLNLVTTVFKSVAHFLFYNNKLDENLLVFYA
jgi:hypothetical protein